MSELTPAELVAKAAEALQRLEKLEEGLVRGTEAIEKVQESLEKSRKALRAAQKAMQATERGLEMDRLALQVERMQQTLQRGERATEAWTKGGREYGKVTRFLQAGKEIPGFLKGVTVAGLQLTAASMVIGAYHDQWSKGRELENRHKLSLPILTYNGESYLVVPVRKDGTPDLTEFNGPPPKNIQDREYIMTKPTDPKNPEETSYVMGYLLPLKKKGGSLSEITGMIKEDEQSPGTPLLVETSLTRKAFQADANARWTDIKATFEEHKNEPWVSQAWDWVHATRTLERRAADHEVNTSTSKTIERPWWQKAARYLPWAIVAAGAFIATVMPVVGVAVAAAGYFLGGKIVDSFVPGASTGTVVMQSPGEGDSPDKKKDAAKTVGDTAALPLGDSKGMDDGVLKDARSATAGIQVTSTGMGALYTTVPGKKSISAFDIT